MDRIHKSVESYAERLLLSDYQALIAKVGTTTLEMKRIQAICIEVCKTFKNLNPPHMRDLFMPRQNDYSLRGSQNLFVPRVHTATYGLRSIRYEGARFWSTLPENLKTKDSMHNFRSMINTWNGPSKYCGVVVLEPFDG